MARKPKAHTVLINPKIVSWRQVVVSSLKLDTTTDDYPLFRAPFKCRIVEATYAQGKDADGTQTAKIQNKTGGTTDLTEALDVDALGLLGSDDFVMIDHTLQEGDFIILRHTASGATQAPEFVSICCDLERLDEQ